LAHTPVLPVQNSTPPLSRIRTHHSKLEWSSFYQDCCSSHPYRPSKDCTFESITFFRTDLQQYHIPPHAVCALTFSLFSNSGSCPTFQSWTLSTVSSYLVPGAAQSLGQEPANPSLTQSLATWSFTQ
jgi:hypothetical protein